MATQFVSTQQRFRKYGEWCPICGGHSGMKPGKGERCAGYLSIDGEYAFCSRPEYAGGIELNEKTTPATFCHKLYGACDCGKEHNPGRTDKKKPHTRKQAPDTSSASIVAEYTYRDKQGRLVYQALRYEPKDFRQRRPDGKGGWDWKMSGVTYVPYRLPELLSAPPRETIYIVEGEKDVETLVHHGFTATTNIGGAGNWQQSCTAYLKGRHVVILPDNDEAGEKHAQDVAKKLQGTARDIRIVQLPGLPEKGDVSDWFASGGTREQFEELTAPARRKYTYAKDVKEESVEWLWEGRLARGELTLGVGDAGIGKGLTCAAIIAKMTHIGGVIFMSPEDSLSRTIVPRLKAAGADLSKIILLNEIDETDPISGERYSRPVSFPEDTPILAEAIEEVGAVLVVIDPILSMLSDRVDAYKNHAVRRAMSAVMSTANKAGAAVLGIMHTTKSQHPNVLFRSSSSSAFIEMARTSLFFVADPDGEPGQSGVIVNYKNNLTKQTSSLRYAIHQNEKGIGYITWEGESRYTREELLNQGMINNKKSEQEDIITSVLKKNVEAMSVEEIWPHTSQTLSALKMMLSRKVEEGLVIRVARGKYTFAGNPLYADHGVTSVTPVTSVPSVMSVTNVTNVTNRESEKTSPIPTMAASLEQREHESNIVTSDVTSNESAFITGDAPDLSVQQVAQAAEPSQSNKSNITMEGTVPHTHVTFAVSPIEHSLDLSYHDCCNMNESHNGQFRTHRANATLQDECGHWWCEQCSIQLEFMNLGCIRNWPELKLSHNGKDFTIEGAKRRYMAFAQNAGYAAVRAALTILQKGSGSKG